MLILFFVYAYMNWLIDSLDANRSDKAPTLLNTCAGNGNAQAVALLIQQGADVSPGTLNELVVQSVKKPEMVDNFLAVYQVTSRSLSPNSTQFRSAVDLLCNILHNMLYNKSTTNRKSTEKQTTSCKTSPQQIESMSPMLCNLLHDRCLTCGSTSLYN